MSKGRKRKPTAAKLRDGSRIRRDLSTEPKPRQGEPLCPDCIKSDEVAWKKWCELVVLLDDMGLLTVAEADVIEQYCRAYADMVKAKALIDKLGMVVESWSEYSMTYKRNPACQEYWAACEMLRKLQPELGLTPSGRAKLSTTQDKSEENPLIALARIG